MGVQVRVTGTGLPVVERRRDQPGPGERGLPLDPAQRRTDRGVVGVLDRLPGRLVHSTDADFIGVKTSSYPDSGRQSSALAYSQWSRGT